MIITPLRETPGMMTIDRKNPTAIGQITLDDSREGRGRNKVSGRGNGKKFRRSFDDAKDKGVYDKHIRMVPQGYQMY